MLTTIIALIVLGILAILAEMVLPAGILGVAGAMGLIAAVILIFSEYGPAYGIAAFVLLMIFGFTVFWFWMKYFHRLPFTRKMIHKTEVGEDETRSEMDLLTGKTGRALTELRPSGRALIDGQRIDAVAEFGYIDKNAGVRVIGTSGATVVVRATR